MDDWDEYWFWMDGKWYQARRVVDLVSPALIVELYEQPGRLHQADPKLQRRGDKPNDRQDAQDGPRRTLGAAS